MCEYHLTCFACRRHLTDRSFKELRPADDPCAQYPNCNPVYKNPPVFVDEACPEFASRGITTDAVGYSREEDWAVADEVEVEYQLIMSLRRERIAREEAAAAAPAAVGEEEEEVSQEALTDEAVAAVNRAEVDLDAVAAANGHVSASEQAMAN
ncbi:hypothetical protein B0T14DRAFT_555378 [Immersiella caudata]|uniref:Uncharacterized protein n=1 Tax=Immersiella caudata TaxID=314043 RepID=A0AA39WRU3_9PEZI|nr:hypothetical protein B0T14DRAFT_555378 [Immersiella caudata]